MALGALGAACGDDGDGGLSDSTMLNTLSSTDAAVLCMEASEDYMAALNAAVSAEDQHRAGCIMEAIPVVTEATCQATLDACVAEGPKMLTVSVSACAGGPGRSVYCTGTVGDARKCVSDQFAGKIANIQALAALTCDTLDQEPDAPDWPASCTAAEDGCSDE